ncbi:MAG: hypothetical protein ABSD38_09220, partial [Syntrophorhabdales bacterium]
LIQGLVDKVGHGYTHMCVSLYPSDKDPETINKKLIRKYRCDTEKSKKCREHKKGAAVFTFIALDHQGIILHTDGELPSYCDDRFQDVRANPVRIIVGPWLAFTIAMEDGTTVVRLSDRTINGMQERLSHALRTRKTALVLEEYVKIDSIVAWRGVIHQKAAIVRWLLGQARVNKVQLRRGDLPFNTLREIVPVYKKAHKK